jgi:hypothetical protein
MATNRKSKARQQAHNGAVAGAQMALWNIAGVMRLALDHVALTDQGFPDELAAAMRLALSEASQASAALDPVA